MKKIAALLALLVVGALLALPQQAQAMTPDSPARSCPGSTPRDLWMRTAMFCAATSPARAEGPYFVNYVDVVGDEQQFCQRWFRDTGAQTECHPYWPFVNPTVNPDLAPASAFNNSRLWATKSTVDSMTQIIRQQDRRIARQAKRIRHLRAQLRDHR